MNMQILSKVNGVAGSVSKGLYNYLALYISIRFISLPVSSLFVGGRGNDFLNINGFTLMVCSYFLVVWPADLQKCT